MAGLFDARGLPTAGPTASWAPLDSKDRDSQSFNGAMLAVDVGDAVGTGGLELFGKAVAVNDFGLGLSDATRRHLQRLTAMPNMPDLDVSAPRFLRNE